MSDIVHNGRVTAIPAKGWVMVEVRPGDDGADCGECRVASLCRSTAESVMSMRVAVPATLSVAVGDRVTVKAPGSLHAKAVTCLLIAPLIALVAVPLLVVAFGGSQGVAALSAIFALAVLLLFLHLWRHRLNPWVVTSVITP